MAGDLCEKIDPPDQIFKAQTDFRGEKTAYTNRCFQAVHHLCSDQAQQCLTLAIPNHLGYVVNHWYLHIEQ